MDNLIRVFNNVLDKERCNYMINKFEDNPKLHYSFDNRGMVFTQINLRGVDWAEEEHFFFEIFKNCVERYRSIMGSTNPENAENGTIRKLFALNIQENSVHGSDSENNAKIEINFFQSFSPSPFLIQDSG